MRSIIKNYLPLILLFCFGNTFSQQNSIAANTPSIDSVYKTSLKHFVLLKLDANTESDNFTFKKLINQKDFNIAPNNDVNLRLTAHYRFLGLAYSFSPFHSNTLTKGKSKNTAIALDVVAGKKLSLSVFYGTTKGYYLENTGDYNATELTSPNKAFAIFPNVKTNILKSENAYYFNGHKFSIRLPVNQYEIQKKSAGSLLVPFNFYRSTINFREDSFTDLNNVNNNVYPEYLSDVFMFTGLGYAYNWVIKPDLVLGVSVTPIIGLDLNRTDYTNKTSSKSNQLTYGLNTSAILAYVSKTWMGGISAETGNWQSFSSSNNLVGKRNYAKIFIGHNFTAPKALVKAFDWIGNRFKK